MARVTSERAPRLLLLAAVFAYLVFGVGRAVGVGLCFEADGHVEIEVMRAGSCADSPLALDEGHDEHHAEHAGFDSEEQCMSCTDVTLPLQELHVKRATGEQGVATPIPVLVRWAVVPAARAFSIPQISHSHSPMLPALSTIVLRT